MRDDAGAREDSEWALDRARSTNEPQDLFPALGVHAYVLYMTGDEPAAREFVVESVEKLEQAFPARFSASGEAVDIWIRVLGGTRITNLLAPGRTPWAEAGRAMAEGDLERALQIYVEVESAPDTALLRRLLAERLVAEGRRAEATPYLDEALAFYRAVGATRFTQETERLLPATA